MSTRLQHYFTIYSKNVAPFMHKQLQEWQNKKPLIGLKVLHHVPLVPNTLLKIACLNAAGAEVIVTNPNFMSAHPEAISALTEDNIQFVENINLLHNQSFDIYFDCGAELFQKLGPPKLGAIELTASGDTFYRSQKLDFPVVSIDLTFTKQLETVFGTAESAHAAITQLTETNLHNKKWLLFGFGKIGRGIAYFCKQHHRNIAIVDVNEEARVAAISLGLKTIDPKNLTDLQNALRETNIVVTATGKTAILENYPKEWFQGKILANMGVLDEYGNQFHESEVLNNKQPVNFALTDPTPMKFIDPEFYAHNIAALQLLNNNSSNGVTDLSLELDAEIIEQWCKYHNTNKTEINKWFLKKR